jgi:putative ABC transport system permease protein
VLANANKFGGSLAAIRVQSHEMKSTLAAIETKWKQFDPKDDFRYVFLDDVIAEQYKSEERARKIFTAFSVLAIFIACMGLFGLVMYSTYQRTKEISIRKVLGASVGNLILVLTQGYIKLIVVSALIAFPIALWGMHSWLQNFAYRVDINISVFVIAFALIIAVTLITISMQALKAAVANPVKNLKTE